MESDIATIACCTLAEDAERRGDSLHGSGLRRRRVLDACALHPVEGRSPDGVHPLLEEGPKIERSIDVKKRSITAVRHIIRRTPSEICGPRIFAA